MEHQGIPPLTVVHVLENPDQSWNGETGLIDREKIERLCQENLHDKAFYICGPPALRDVTLDNLRALKISPNRIHLEIFSLLD
jgi:NAD(P)H-flavin reductase